MTRELLKKAVQLDNDIEALDSIIPTIEKNGKDLYSPKAVAICIEYINKHDRAAFIRVVGVVRDELNGVQTKLKKEFSELK